MKKKEPKFSPGVAALKNAFEKMYVPENFKDKYTFKFNPYSAVSRKVPKGCKTVIKERKIIHRPGCAVIGVGINDDVYVSLYKYDRPYEAIISKTDCSKLIDWLGDIRKKHNNSVREFKCKDKGQQHFKISYNRNIAFSIEIIPKSSPEIPLALAFEWKDLQRMIKVFENIEQFLRPYAAKKRKSLKK